MGKAVGLIGQEKVIVCLDQMFVHRQGRKMTQSGATLSPQEPHIILPPSSPASSLMVCWTCDSATVPASAGSSWRQSSPVQLPDYIWNSSNKVPEREREGGRESGRERERENSSSHRYQPECLTVDEHVKGSVVCTQSITQQQWLTKSLVRKCIELESILLSETSSPGKGKYNMYFLQ